MVKLANFFENNPVFTRDELEQYVDGKRSGNSKTLEQMINYHLEKENIGQVKRGLFYTVKRGYSVSNCPVDLMLVTGKMRKDAILAYHTALDFHGRAHSMYNEYYFLTKKAKNTRKTEFRGSTIKPIQTPKSLLDSGKERLGVKLVDRKGLDISITNLERTLVDLLDRPDLSGGWEEIWQSTGGFGFLNMNEVIEYTVALDNATTTAKVGYFLEQHQDQYDVEEQHLDRLEQYAPNQPRYMDKSYDESTMVSRWNLIVPDDVMERNWKEF